MRWKVITAVLMIGVTVSNLPNNDLMKYIMVYISFSYYYMTDRSTVIEDEERRGAGERRDRE